MPADFGALPADRARMTDTACSPNTTAGAGGTKEMAMEYVEQTVARLRERLGREPTAEEVKAERDARWKMQYASMLVTDALLRDEAEKADK